jgi:hypothetical protein
MRHAIAAMAAQGNNLIVDDVLLGEEKAEYRELLAPFGPASSVYSRRLIFLKRASGSAAIG